MTSDTAAGRRRPAPELPPAPPPPLRRNRDFQLLWLGQAVSELGSTVALLAYPLLVLATTGSASLAGVVGLAAYGVGLALRLPAGALADRVDRRRLMIAADLLRVAAMAALAVALLAGLVSLWLIVLVAAVESAGYELFRFAERAALRNVVPAGQLGDALARNEARTHAAGLLGPALSGWLFAVGRAVPFVVNAVTYLVSVLGLLLVRGRLQQPRGTGVPPTRGGGTRQTLGWMWRQPLLRVFLVWSATANLVFAAVGLALVATAEQRGATSATIGTVVALASLGGVLGAVAGPPIARALPPPALLVGASWLLPAAVAGLALTSGVWPLAAVFGAAIFFVPLVNMVLGAHQLAITPDHLQGRVASLAMLVGGCLQPLGPLLGGGLHDLVGPRATFLTLAGLLGGVAAVTTGSRAIRRLGPVARPGWREEDHAVRGHRRL